jgi:hypothetical protein
MKRELLPDNGSDRSAKLVSYRFLNASRPPVTRSVSYTNPNL